MPSGAGVTVAVVDSGWDRGDADARVLPGINLVDAPAESASAGDATADLIGHGTVCIHRALAVAPNIRVLPIRVFGEHLETSPRVLVDAIERAIEAGAHILNLSLATRREDARDRLYLACERAREAGVCVVAAARPDAFMYPAAFDPVISVGGGDWDDLMRFTYHDNEAIECVAAGRALARRPGQPIATVCAASYAAPVVSGLIALWRERFGPMDLVAVREMLERFSQPAPAGSATPA